MLAATTHARGQQLQSKANRPSKFMLGLMPAGSGDLDCAPERDDYEEGDEGLADWCNAVDASVDGFAEAQRTATTFKEHVAYMASISDWCVQRGLGAFARKAKGDDKVRFGPIAPVLKKDGSVRVMPPQVLLAMWSQMVTGDERVCKGMGILKRAQARIEERKAAAATEATEAAVAAEGMQLVDAQSRVLPLHATEWEASEGACICSTARVARPPPAERSGRRRVVALATQVR